MDDKEKQPTGEVGEMHKRRETMPDGVRYIIFYTFSEKKPPQSEVTENV